VQCFVRSVCSASKQEHTETRASELEGRVRDTGNCTAFWRSSPVKYHYLKMTAFCDMVPCSLLQVNRRFRGVYSLHAPLKRRSTKRLQGTTSQKAVIFILVEIITRNLKSLLAEALVRQITYTPSVLKQYSSVGECTIAVIGRNECPL
jgi:hypothetical protein